MGGGLLAQILPKPSQMKINESQNFVFSTYGPLKMYGLVVPNMAIVPIRHGICAHIEFAAYRDGVARLQEFSEERLHPKSAI